MDALSILGLALWTAAAPASAATLIAVGDIRLDGPVGAIIRRSGPKAPLSGLAGAFQDADIVFGNLECPLTKRGAKVAKTWNFRAPPDHLAALTQGGFTLVNLANNHAYDYGAVGFLDTLAALKKHGLPYIGGGKDLDEAQRLKVVAIGGLKVGLMGFTSTHPAEGWAKKNRAGVAYSDFDRFPAVIAAARPKCDVLVVSFHGGTELAEDANDIQKAFAHMAVDAGADLVLGHHPHVLQAVELYKGKPIVYSLGNFLFVSPSPATRTTVVARVTLGRGGVEGIVFTPFDTNWGRPILAGPDGRAAALAALDRLGTLSAHPERFRLDAAAVETPPQIR